MSNPMTGIGGAPTRATTFDETPAGRKAAPVASGVLDYFPDAIVALAGVSFKGNEQHNPGKPLFWNRSKSGDESDALMRHFLQRGTVDTDGLRHSAKMAWRALALLQKEIEGEARAASSPLPPCPYLGDGACTHLGRNMDPYPLKDTDSPDVDVHPVFGEIEREADGPVPELEESGDVVVPSFDADACGTLDGLTPLPPPPQSLTEVARYSDPFEAPEGYYIDGVKDHHDGTETRFFQRLPWRGA